MAPMPSSSLDARLHRRRISRTKMRRTTYRTSKSASASREIATRARQEVSTRSRAKIPARTRQEVAAGAGGATARRAISRVASRVVAIRRARGSISAPITARARRRVTAGRGWINRRTIFLFTRAGARQKDESEANGRGLHRGPPRTMKHHACHEQKFTHFPASWARATSNPRRK